jgi:hypothetical protein
MANIDFLSGLFTPDQLGQDGVIIGKTKVVSHTEYAHPGAPVPRGYGLPNYAGPENMGPIAPTGRPTQDSRGGTQGNPFARSETWQDFEHDPISPTPVPFADEIETGA